MFDNDNGWQNLTDSTKKDALKYLKLMRRFQNNPSLIPKKHKKWMLENCDLPTDIIPNDLLTDENIWLN